MTQGNPRHYDRTRAGARHPRPRAFPRNFAAAASVLTNQMVPVSPTPVGAGPGTGRRHGRHGACSPWKWLLLGLLAPGLLLPRLAAAQSAEYRIGPQDMLVVKVYETTEFDGEVRVSPDGRIALPVAGDISVAGMT